MKNVCFLLPEVQLKPTSLFAAIDVLEKANEFYIRNSGYPYYQITIAGAEVRQSIFSSRFILTTQSIYDISAPDIIIIPAIEVIDEMAIKRNEKLLSWISMQHQKGAEVASMCTGAFMLAAANLVKGKECSTHWRAENKFRDLFPDVNLRIDKIMTDNSGIYTSGGAISSLNLIIHLVEKYNGREAAVYCAKVMQLDMDRNNQSQFAFFENQKNHDDEVIRKMQLFIEKNIQEKITVDYLADRFALAKRSLTRRFKKATNNSPTEYIQRVKMEAAKRRLEDRKRNVNEIMYSVGYTDVKAFRSVFKKVTGLTPIKYREKFTSVRY